MKKISSTALLALGLTPIAYLVSYYLLSYYSDGDQESYHLFYAALYGADIFDIVDLSIRYVGAAEPLPAFVLWIGSNLGIEKNVYISLWNIILINSLFYLARKHKVPPLIIALFLTNFYILVLITSAERLKFAYILILIGSLLSKRKQIAILALTPFAHLQSFIFLASVLLAHYEKFIKDLVLRLNVGVRTAGMVIVAPAVIAAMGWFLLDGIIAKGTYYAGEAISMVDLLNIGFLGLVALHVTDNRFRMLLAIFPLVIAIMVIGSARVNMIAVTVVLYFFLIERKFNNPLVVALMLYFSIKSIPFIHDILIYNEGFTYATSWRQLLGF